MVKRILSAVIAAFAVGLVAEAQEKNTAELEKRMAVVELSSIYMRQQPDYESALETQELMGTVVEIVGEQGYWREIVSPQPYRAWATEKGLVEMSEEEIEAYMKAPKVMFAELYGHVYMEPSFKAATLCDLVGGDILRPARYCADTGLHAHSGKADEGRARKDGTELRLKGRWTEVMLPSGKRGYVPTDELKPHSGFTSVAQGEGNAESIDIETTEEIIAEAHKLLGSPYLWGGMSAKGVDCSGLVRISHIMNGILLPRNASQQINCGERVEMDIDSRFWDETLRMQGSAKDKWNPEFHLEMLKRIKNLRRGDLVFFGTPASEPGKKPRITHVGIYLGEGRIIHSSHMVRINSLIPGDPDYYENAHKLIAAVRL